MKTGICCLIICAFYAGIFHHNASAQTGGTAPAAQPTAPAVSPTIEKKAETAVPAPEKKTGAAASVPEKKAAPAVKKTAAKAPVKKTAVVKADGPGLTDIDASLSKASEKVVPSVVSVKVVRGERTGVFSTENNPAFPFNAPSVRPSTIVAGSGIILDKRGNIVTNYHVIQDAAMVTVQLFDMREYSCDIVGIDPVTDIAVIRIALNVPNDIAPAEFTDSSKVKAGQLAVAVGNSYGYANTVSMGIVSATGRPGSSFAESGDFLQTDAALNPGNSGGALADSKGRIIGMNTAVYARSGGVSGLGFSIPSNAVKDISEKIIASGMIVRGWSGLMIQDLNPDRASRLNLPMRGGAVVTETIKDSPSASAGVLAGDIILSADGQQIGSARALHDRIVTKKPGDKLTLSVLRGGKKIDINIFMGSFSGEIKRSEARSGKTLGLGVSDVDEDTALQYGITDKNGVVVSRIDTGLAAEASGIEQGDLVLEVDGKPVPTLEAFSRVMEKTRTRNSVVFMLKRRGSQKYVTIYTK